MLALFLAHWRAKKRVGLANYKTPYKMLGAGQLATALFWQLDVVGVLLMIAVFALILTPLAIAGGVQEQWKTAHVLAPLVIGICCVPVFVLWERRSPHPMVPFHVGARFCRNESALRVDLHRLLHRAVHC